jgi:hypothetical protein
LGALPKKRGESIDKSDNVNDYVNENRNEDNDNDNSNDNDSNYNSPNHTQRSKYSPNLNPSPYQTSSHNQSHSSDFYPKFVKTTKNNSPDPSSVLYLKPQLAVEKHLISGQTPLGLVKIRVRD